ncbi:hypothetical protein P1X15_12605 [Runella sp. MFBS21]|uniref:hypothetical protein n=1 Tax=Runella sp. MFBS21 TaxID=3034018 RepID=UPI0023F6D549|nr:hypothetical protein [Runella sp. MFBS21]MDF7818447.1 hypothetical protein [Runella sp. MFBS21]
MKPPLILVLLYIFVSACNRPAEDIKEAQTRLTGAPKWYIQEILMDDAPVFKEGKHIPHISGVQFDTYMDWVRFDPNGAFEGHFKGASETKMFQWEVYPKQNVIALRDTVAKTGGWNIYPRNVYEDHFEMETRSTIYDPPRMTKLTLKFKKNE